MKMNIHIKHAFNLLMLILRVKLTSPMFF
uniref:Uncharacterized protein n=1 Tax=Rhizophora mucronata TaxID=61149 RepID=A0A2P2QIK9_RHIMU